jgi:ABC-type spermidine/putrescine transport system permease subunit II
MTDSDCDPVPGAKRRELQVAGYSLLWAIVFVGAARLLDSPNLSRPVAVIIALIPTVLGAVLLFGYTRYLRSTDELQRLIQLQAMGWAFGGGILAASGYSLFMQLGAPRLDATTFAALMAIFFAIGLVIGRWRYK